MAARLCEVLNSLLSFAVRHEFTKKHLLYLLKIYKKLILVHHLEVIYYFAY